MCLFIIGRNSSKIRNCVIIFYINWQSIIGMNIAGSRLVSCRLVTFNILKAMPTISSEPTQDISLIIEVVKYGATQIASMVRLPW